MYCPVCKSKETKVLDSRVSQDGFTIRRRRVCNVCEYRFSTIEEMELLDIVVVKNNGKREGYMRKKLENGIMESLKKRPFTQDSFDRMVHSIERDIRRKNKREITSPEIGEIVMRHLKKFDSVAYIRFASIYRAFEDVAHFETELSSFKKKKKIVHKNKNVK